MKPFIITGNITDSTLGHENSELLICVLINGSYTPVIKIDATGVYHKGSDWVPYLPITNSIIVDPVEG